MRLRIAAPKSENELGKGKVTERPRQAEQRAGGVDLRQKGAWACRRTGWLEDRARGKRVARGGFKKQTAAT